MKEFHVNNYITLKLEDGRTNIYVDGELFEQCKFLLLNIPVEQVSSLDEIESVDEAAENLSKKMEKRFFPWGENEMVDIEIPPEVEFWAHSSNLQVWSEYNYDTRLIHSNLAFPLLKRLTEVGDPIAKRVFKEEIAKKLESGYWPVIKFLMEENYKDYVSREEFLSCILGNDEQGQKETAFILQLEETIGREFDLEKEYDPEYNNFAVRNRHIVEMSIYTGSNINEVLPLIGSLNSLKMLIILCKDLTNLPDSFGDLKELELLHASNNKLQKLPQSLKKLSNMQNLNLRNNSFIEFPKVISNLKSLEELDLSGNQIRTIPDEVGNLGRLKTIWLNNNNINELPESISELELLENLYLTNNCLKELPNSIKNLENLKFIDIYNNNFQNKSRVLEKLEKKGLKINY